jgi:hypothetical protein
VPSIHHRPKLTRVGNLRELSDSDRSVVTCFSGARSIIEIALSNRARTFAVWELAARAAGRGYAEVLPPAKVCEGAEEDTFGSVRNLALAVEQCIDDGRLAKAWTTLELLGRRFKAASDIDVIVGSLRHRLEKAVRHGIPDPASRVVIGTLDESVMAIPPDHPERQVLTRINGPTPAAAVVKDLPGEPTAGWCLLLELLSRGVIELHEP